MSDCMHCLVSGRVQGVFFRASTRKEARRLGIDGWVRNLPDGRVEVLACGPGDALEALRAWLNQGPPGARVDHVRIEFREADEPLSGFNVR